MSGDYDDHVNHVEETFDDDYGGLRVPSEMLVLVDAHAVHELIRPAGFIELQAVEQIMYLGVRRRPAG
jgi:hypothetical protein